MKMQCLYVLSLSLIVCGSLQAQTERTPVMALAPSPEETSALVEQIRRDEYRFNPVKVERGVWSAPNRGQELRSRVSERGIEVFPRSTSAEGVGASWKLALATRTFGRVDAPYELPPAIVSVRGDRVELDHGFLIEWFVNEERGIEQGWTIAERPMGVDELWIELSIEGDLSLHIEEGGRSGVFVDACGEAVLPYRDLRAFDATGRELDARLTSGSTGVAIAVDDSGAVYPLTVDPLLTSPAWIVESDQAFAGLGNSVATAGDVNGDGYSDVIVGAYNYDNGQPSEGRAFVYHGSASGLAASPAWTAESDQMATAFGYSVSTAGDVNGDGYSDVIVGAPYYSNGQSSEGRAYAYHGSASGLAASPAWTAESNLSFPSLGYSVSTAGDVNGDGYSDVIVGAPYYSNGQGQEGRAYAYHGSASGLATSPAWTVESNHAGAEFGTSVSTAGDVNGDGYSDVIVGPRYYSNGEFHEGRAFAYHGSSSGLAASPSWTAESDQADALFGLSVATAGDVNGDGYSDVIVGAPLYSNGQSEEGRAYAYQGSASGLAASPAWTAESDQAGGRLGLSVSTAGDVNGDGYSDVIVGAYWYDNGQSNEGRAYAYHGSASGLAASPGWTAESDQADAEFGLSVSTAGDVNGDGFSDVIVGAYSYDNGEINEGRAYVYHGFLGDPPATYCTGKTTSGSCVPFLSHSGTPSATGGPFNIFSNDHIELEVGLYLYSSQKANLDFHGGKLCVKAPFQRLSSLIKATDGIACTSCAGNCRMLKRNFNALIQSGADPLLTPGQNVRVQVRQRDPADPTGFADNLSNGIAFTIEP